MPLHILAPMVVLGLALVIGAAWWSDRHKRHRALTVKDYQERFLIDFPNEQVLDCMVAAKGEGAVLRLHRRDRLGLVFTMGQNQSTRLLEPALVREIRLSTDRLDLVLNDFSAHVVGLDFADPAQLATVAGWIDETELT